MLSASQGFCRSGGKGAPTGQLATGWLTNIHTPFFRVNSFLLCLLLLCPPPLPFLFFFFFPESQIIIKNYKFKKLKKIKISLFSCLQARCKRQNNNPQPNTWGLARSKDVWTEVLFFLHIKYLKLLNFVPYN